MTEEALDMMHQNPSHGLIGLAMLLSRWDCRITQQGSVHLGRTAYMYGVGTTPPNPSQIIFFFSEKQKQKQKKPCM